MTRWTLPREKIPSAWFNVVPAARCSTSCGCGAPRRCSARSGWRRRWARRRGSKQLALAGERLPDVVIAPCGGGSNLGGIAFPFVPDSEVRLLAVEPLSCPTLTQGEFGYDFGDTEGLTPLLPMYSLDAKFCRRRSTRAGCATTATRR